MKIKRLSNILLLLVVFKWHHGSERVKLKYVKICYFLLQEQKSDTDKVCQGMLEEQQSDTERKVEKSYTNSRSKNPAQTPEWKKDTQANIVTLINCQEFTHTSVTELQAVDTSTVVWV